MKSFSQQCMKVSSSMKANLLYISIIFDNHSLTELSAVLQAIPMLIIVYNISIALILSLKHYYKDRNAHAQLNTAWVD